MNMENPSFSQMEKAEFEDLAEVIRKQHEEDTESLIEWLRLKLTKE